MLRGRSNHAQESWTYTLVFVAVSRAKGGKISHWRGYNVTKKEWSHCTRMILFTKVVKLWSSYWLNSYHSTRTQPEAIDRSHRIIPPLLLWLTMSSEGWLDHAAVRTGSEHDFVSCFWKSRDWFMDRSSRYYIHDGEFTILWMTILR